jgi:general secretion pathway protein K
MRRTVPERERGAALLTVLLLVAVMAALSAAALERLRLSTALAVNSAALDQARAYAIGVESLIALTVDDLIARSPERTTLAGGWNGQSRRIPMPDGGAVHAAVRDGGNCFNLNSVAEGRAPGALSPRLIGIRQFEDLMRVLGLPQDQARRISEAAGDWVDSDGDRAPAGAEDAQYGPNGTAPATRYSPSRASCAPCPESPRKSLRCYSHGSVHCRPRNCRRSTSTR